MKWLGLNLWYFLGFVFKNVFSLFNLFKGLFFIIEFFFISDLSYKFS